MNDKGLYFLCIIFPRINIVRATYDYYTSYSWIKLSFSFGFRSDYILILTVALPAMQETWVHFLGRKDLLEEGMATHSSILAGKIPWTEEPGGLQSVGPQRAGHDWATENYQCLYWWLSSHGGGLKLIFYSFPKDTVLKSKLPEVLNDVDHLALPFVLESECCWIQTPSLTFPFFKKKNIFLALKTFSIGV